MLFNNRKDLTSVSDKRLIRSGVALTSKAQIPLCRIPRDVRDKSATSPWHPCDKTLNLSRQNTPKFTILRSKTKNVLPLPRPLIQWGGGCPLPHTPPPSVPLAPQMDPQQKFHKSSSLLPKTNSWLRLWHKKRRIITVSSYVHVICSQ